MKRRHSGKQNRRKSKKRSATEIENLSPSSSRRTVSDEYVPSSSDFSSNDGGVGVSYGSARGKAVIGGTDGNDSWEVDSDDPDGGSAFQPRRKKRNRKRRQKKRKGERSDPSDGSDGEKGPEIIDLDEPSVEPRGAWRRKRRGGRRERRRREKGEPPLIWEVLEDENEEWIDEHEKDEVDLDGGECTGHQTAEPPPDLIMPLLRFQKEWLAWALEQEESPIRGGILADEMGMGKTIQAISLVLAARAFRPTYHEFLSPSSSMSPALPKIKGTLVICPLVAVVQWMKEIMRFTTKGSVNVLVYHGAKREKAIQQLSTYDFVLTTYSIVEADYRKNNMPPKERCQWCGKLLYPRKMAIHLKYFCGPNAVKTEKQSKQAKKKQRESFGGAKKKFKAVQEEEDEDVVVELKSVNRKGAQKGKKRGQSSNKDKLGFFNDEPRGEASLPGKSILHSVKWERIILDEAHYIKDRRSNTARAVLSLQSWYKWALSGTPLQNRVGELYSLIRFLQITPYSYYYCKDCDCKSLDYSSTVDCPNCIHKASRHFCWWNRCIAKPIQKSGYVNDGRRAMILLKNKLLKSVVLRRTKKGRAADLALPPRIVSLRRDNLDKTEEDFYEALYTRSQAQFNTYVEAGTLMNNYAHIFDLLTRLRQAVDHPYLVIYSQSSLPSASKIENAEQQECGICHDPSEDPAVTSCEHVFCKACLLDYSTALGQVSCPSCSRPLTVDFTTMKNPDDHSHSTSIKGFRRSSILNKINLEDFQTSTKIEALREEIRRMVERDGSAKAIVFSQFTSFLDLINYSLQKSGINCVQLVGSMSIAARDDAIKKFSDDPKCRIFLMSLKAGGVALNLTVASYVFLMDPWWNPAVERQAQDRIHRIGQYKPIRIVRFVIENTIEERILRLQEKKELVFEGTVGGSSEALGRLTESDLKFLFHS